MEQTDICYVVSHGFASRMLLQTGLIRKLADTGKLISIILPDAQDTNFQKLANHPNITLHETNIPLTIFDDDYGFKRRYFLEDIRSNPVFVEKHIHSLIYSKSKHPWKRVRPLYYYMIYLLIKIFPGIRTRFQKNENKYLKSTAALNLLKEINPKTIVSTYPVNYLEAKFLHAAETLGIKKIIHLLSWDNITSKGIFPVKADHYIAWGEVMASEFKDYYHLEDRDISICGVPHFDHHINRTKDIKTIENLGLDPKKPIVFLAMSSPRFAPYEIEIVEEIATWDFQLIVRPHPQNMTGTMADLRWVKRLEALKSDGVAISYPTLEKSKIRWSMNDKDMDDLTDIIYFSTLNLNSGSTVSIDSLILGKPVVITSFDGNRKLNYWKSARRLTSYVHLNKLIKQGGVEVAHDYSELKELIKKYLTQPDFKKDERSHAVQMECYKLDGNSTERVIEAMLKHG